MSASIISENRSKMPTTTQLNFIQPSLHGTPTTIKITDARNTSKTLDTNGFQLHPHTTSLTTNDFYNDDTVTTTYYNELITTVQELTGAAKVLPIIHSIRNAQANFAFNPKGKSSSNAQANRGTTTQLAEYVPLVHCDNSFAQGESMMTNILHRTNETMDHTKHRYQIINVWRNIRKEPISQFNHPLAVLDVTTMDVENDFLLTKSDLPKLKKNQPYHKWFWYSDMTKDEILCFTRWDSRGKAQDDIVDEKGKILSCHGLPGDSRGVSTFHSAWCNPNPLTNYLDNFVVPGRESCDTLLVLVFDL